MATNKSDVFKWEAKVDTTNDTITTVTTQIKDANEYISDRKVDLKDHTDDLASENTDYDLLAKNFKDL